MKYTNFYVHVDGKIYEFEQIEPGKGRRKVAIRAS